MLYELTASQLLPIDRTQLDHRYAPVLAKWSRSTKETCNTFSTIFARRNFISKKYTYAETLVIQMFLRIVHTILPSKFFHLRHKTPSAPKIFAALLQKHKYLKHKSHRKPTDLLQICYGGPETCSTPIPLKSQQPNDRS